jgi:hypothetical protein
MEMSGHIQVVPVRHRVNGDSGCLIELSMGGETLGVWRGLDADGWVDLYLTLHGNESTLDASLGLTLQPWMVEPSIDADLTVDWLEAGNSQRQNMSFSGPLWFGLDNGRLTMEGRTDGGDVSRLILEVPDLRSVQEDDWDDDVQGVQWAGQWRLSSNIESKSEKWLGFWSGRRCEIDDDSDDLEGAMDSSQR